MFARPLITIASPLLLLVAFTAAAQDRGIRLGETTISQWRFGVVIKALGAARGIEATLPVPMDWPEQTIKRISEEKTPNVHGVTFKTLDGGVKQMVVSVPRLPAGGEASAVLTFEVAKRRIEPPRDTGIYRLP